MEIPSSAGGVVKELKVKVGDKVQRGLAGAAARCRWADAPASAAAPAPRACSVSARSVAPPAPAAAAPPAPRPPAASGERRDRRARHRRLRRGRGDRGARQGRATPSPVEQSLDHRRERQGVDGDSVVARPASSRTLQASRSATRSRKGTAIAVGAKAAGGAPAAPPPRRGGTPAAGRQRLRAQPRHRPSGHCPPPRCRRTSRPRRAARLPHASPSDPEARARARRAARRSEGQRSEGPHHAGGPAGIRQGGDAPARADEGAAAAKAPAGAACGGGIRRTAAVAAGRLREVRPDRAQGPVAHQEDQRPGAAPQLGDDPARHRTTTTPTSPSSRRSASRPTRRTRSRASR